MGGKHFKNDDAFIRTAVRDVKRLERLAGLTTDSRLLDWGCGAGRLAVGVRRRLDDIRPHVAVRCTGTARTGVVNQFKSK